MNQNENREPKVKNRFLVEFPAEMEIQPFRVKEISPIKLTNSYWENIRIVFNDFINPSMGKSLYELAEMVSKIQDFETGIEPFEIKIHLTDPTSFVYETWIITVRRIVSISFGSFKYNEETNLTPYIIVSPSHCQLIVNESYRADAKG